MPRATSLAGIFTLLVLVFSSPLHASRQAQVPDWVRQAASVAMPPLRAHDAAVILLDQREITVDAQGRALVHERKVIKLLTAAGRTHAVYPLYYEQATRVHFLHSWTIDPEEHTYQLDDKDMTDAPAIPDFAVFSSERVRLARAMAAEPGSLVAFESEYQEAPYLTAWEWSLDQDIPTAGMSVSLTLPPGFAYHDGWSHMEPVKAEQLSATAWRWQIGPRASLDDEAGAPEMGEVGGRMMLAYSGGAVAPADGSWSGVGQWYDALTRDRTQVSPDIAAKVAQLTAGRTGFTEKLLAITGFMQDEIRYVAVEMGIGGWQPHPASEVFAHRYGDCKDKASLLLAMLATVNIKAYPLLVDFDHRIDPAMPSHYADHMILAIEVPADVQDASLKATVPWQGRRLLIFDPTNSVSPAGSLEPELQGTYGVLLSGSSSMPILLPTLSPLQNVLVRKGTFTLAADGSLTGEVEETRSGNTGDVLRHLEIRGDMRKLQERTERSARSSLANFTLSGLSTEHARERNQPLTVHYRVDVNGYTKHAGSLLLVRPAVLGMEAVRGAGDNKPRLYPLALGQEEDIQEEYSIQLPSGFQMEDLPAPTKVETAFATFVSSASIQDQQLHYKSELIIRQMEVPASQYQEYVTFFGKVASAGRDEALIKPAS